MSRNYYNKDTFLATLGCAIGLVGAGWALAMRTKLAKISERLDQSIDDLANDMEIDIPEEMVNKAVEKAVAAESKKAVEKATSEALAELKRDIHKTVSGEVEKEYAHLSKSVLQEITDAAAKIDVAKVRRDVERAAEKAALDKFDDNLDDILKKFNDNLDNTSKIYNSIAGTMSKRTDGAKEYVFRVG